MKNISSKRLFDWYQQARQEAIANKIDPDELAWLLQTITNLSSLSLRLGSYQNLEHIESQKSLSELNQLWEQRLQERLPIQYLAETVFWRRFQLKVTPGVLIPRPETELIIDLAQAAAPKNNLISQEQQNWLDLGTGSGAIALGLADSFTQATIYAVDCSSDALKIAQDNAISLGLQSNIRFYQGSWWKPIKFLQGQVSGMVSNPPYIPSAQIEQLQPEVANHEPHLALDGGSDGLDEIRHLIEVAPLYLISGGVWLVEIMVGQHQAVVELLTHQGEYNNIQVFKDLNGIDRFVLAYRR